MKLRASPILDRNGRRHAVPVPPPWFTDAVELYAREWGRRSVTRWEPAVGCFVSYLSRKDDDPALAAVQQQARADDGEPIYWHEWTNGPVRPHPILGPSKMVPGYLPADIEQLGIDGVLRKLRSENTWSGVGMFRSHDESIEAILAKHHARDQQHKQTLRDGLSGPLKATLRHNKGHALGVVPDNITPKVGAAS